MRGIFPLNPRFVYPIARSFFAVQIPFIIPLTPSSFAETGDDNSLSLSLCVLCFLRSVFWSKRIHHPAVKMGFGSVQAVLVLALLATSCFAQSPAPSPTLTPPAPTPAPVSAPPSPTPAPSVAPVRSLLTLFATLFFLSLHFMYQLIESTKFNISLRACSYVSSATLSRCLHQPLLPQLRRLP